MKVLVLVGRNNITNQIGVVGVASSSEKIEKIFKKNEYQLDDHLITEHEVN